MSTPIDPTPRSPDDCGCCEGLEASTPVAVTNRPGLSAIAYRVGTHARFRSSLLAALGRRAEGLRTRDDDDFTIALLDAWASVADVLTFYQERIANESYLRTATERLSVSHLARLIGYQPLPGVASTAYLAFTVDPSSKTAQVAVGTRVQNVPAQGKQPQTFETVESLEARAAWNALEPRLTKPHPFKEGGVLLETFYLAGVKSGVRAGDGVLVSAGEGEKPHFFRVAEVTPEPEKKRTEIRLQPPPKPGTAPPLLTLLGPILIPGFTQLPPSATTARLLGSSTYAAADLSARAVIEGFNLARVFVNLAAVKPPPPGLLRFKTRAAIFGHNAPPWTSLPVSLRVGELDPKTKQWSNGPYTDKLQWVDDLDLREFPGAGTAPTGEAYLFLDTTYPEIAKGSWIVLQDGGAWKNTRVEDAAEVSLSAFTLSAKVTRLSVKKDDDLKKLSVRGTTVFAASEVLELARLPVTRPVSGTTIELDGWVDGLTAGQSIIVSGELADDRGNRAAEHALIDEVKQVIKTEGSTELRLKNTLGNSYVRDTVTINANVAQATHGETVEKEVLGSGDGSRTFQGFALKRSPLTHVSAATVSGTLSTLEVRVDGVRWHEAGDLSELGPEDRRYLTRTDEGKTRVVFGDGQRGARLPTGLENVTARYRFGLGEDGDVGAGTLTLLAKRPPGVSAVTNPMPASGGDDAESRDQARTNAPLGILTLGRVVSLRDYEDFARAFAGIAKALATWSWNGEARGVFVTVAGPGGKTVPEDTRKKLRRALREAGDPHVSLRVEPYRPAFFRFAAGVRVDADHERQEVLRQIEKEARTRFSFTRRQLGQPVTLGEVTALVQGVAGVEATNVSLLYRGETRGRASTLLAALPRPGSASEEIRAAELLTLDPRPLEIGGMT